MGKIKSALELAMEKTADLKTDKKAIQKTNITREGKTTASSFLDKPTSSELKEKLDFYKDEEQSWFKSGAIDTVLANITLPRVPADLDKLEQLSAALSILSGKEQDTKDMFSQLRQLLEQYLANLDQLEESLKQQYEPQLRQKEMQLKQQSGQDIHLTAESDPDFLKILSEQLQNMDQQYNEVLKQAKEQIRQENI